MVSVSADNLYLLLLLGVGHGHGHVVLFSFFLLFCLCRGGRVGVWSVRHPTTLTRTDTTKSAGNALHHHALSQSQPTNTTDASSSFEPNVARGDETNNVTMHLMYYLDENGKRVYTLKVRRCYFTLCRASVCHFANNPE